MILGMGKFGGREMNYHSDLDIVFLYEADGQTAAEPEQSARQTTTNQHFFSELGQRIIKIASRLSSLGRLYEVDARLRPTGKSGALTTTFKEFVRYFLKGGGQLWERQALCKARVVYGSPTRPATGQRRRDQGGLRPPLAEERHRGNPPHAPANGRNSLGRRFKARDGRNRGYRIPRANAPASTWAEQSRTSPTNTLAALSGLYAGGLISADDYELFDAGYRLLRTIEGRLRLMNSTARDQLPQDPTELAKLAHLLHYPGSDGLMMDIENATRQTRRASSGSSRKRGKKRGTRNAERRTKNKRKTLLSPVGKPMTNSKIFQSDSIQN